MYSLLAVGCKQGEAVAVDGVEIEVEELPVEKKITDLFCDFELLSLDTDGDGAFRSIDKLVHRDSCYYILDKTGRRQVLIFDEKGKYKGAIGRQGKGHGEYTHIEDFTIDDTGGRVIILGYPSTAYVYSKDGEFVMQKRLGENTLLWSMTNYDNGYVCSTNHATYTEGEHAFLLYFYDKDFNFVAKRVPVLPVQVQIPPFASKLFTDLGRGQLAYFDGYTGSVYKIDTSRGIQISRYSYKIDNPMPVELYSKPNDFVSEQLKYNFFMKALGVGDSLLAFYVNDGKISGIVTGIGSDRAESFSYGSWLPGLLDYDGGTIYSKISRRQVEENRALLGKMPADSLGKQSNDFILKFRLRNARQ